MEDRKTLGNPDFVTDELTNDDVDDFNNVEGLLDTVEDAMDDTDVVGEVDIENYLFNMPINLLDTTLTHKYSKSEMAIDIVILGYFSIDQEDLLVIQDRFPVLIR